MKKITIIITLSIIVMILLAELGRKKNHDLKQSELNSDNCLSVNSEDRLSCFLKKEDFKYVYFDNYFMVKDNKKIKLEQKVDKNLLILKRVDEFKEDLLCNTDLFIKEIGSDFISFYAYKKNQIITCRNGRTNELVYFISEDVSLDSLVKIVMPKSDFDPKKGYPKDAIFN